jgi:hypothetical protein
MGISQELQDVITGKNLPEGIQRIEPKEGSTFITFKISDSQTAEGSLGKRLMGYAYRILVNSRSDGKHLDMHPQSWNSVTNTWDLMVNQYGIKTLQEFGGKSDYVGY